MSVSNNQHVILPQSLIRPESAYQNFSKQRSKLHLHQKASVSLKHLGLTNVRLSKRRYVVHRCVNNTESMYFVYQLCGTRIYLVYCYLWFRVDWSPKHDCVNKIHRLCVFVSCNLGSGKTFSSSVPSCSSANLSFTPFSVWYNERR